jgi:glycosyltransferase involved in cell wall biosynthesis
VRILYVSDGHQVHDQRFLDAIENQGHQALYLRTNSARSNGALGSRSAAGLQPIAQSWPVFMPGQALRMRSALRELNPDLVHAGPVQHGAFLAALAGFRPLVTMSWGSDLLMGARRGSGRWSARYTLRRSDVVLCDCEVVRERAVELGAARDRTVVFPWGVDLDHFTPTADSAVRGQLGWEDEFVLISTRGLEPTYGLDILIDGFVIASRAIANLRLLLLGDGSLADSLRAALQRAGLAKAVHFAGIVDHATVPTYYRAADLYLSASRSDGSSISLLESMASGLPALVSDIPANREWVEPGQNGWWFKDGDSQALADRIVAIARQGDALGKLGVQSRRIAESRADWARNSRKLAQAYELAARVSA